MRSTTLPPHMSDIAAANPDATIRMSYSVDALVPDELQREINTLPAVRDLDVRRYRSERAAHEHVLMLMAMQRTGEFPLSPLDEARKMVAPMFKNLVESSPEIAERALQISPLCAEAYIVLANAEPTPASRLQLLQTGLNIAVEQVDNTKFDGSHGYFWQYLVTRPYMRCRISLAFELWRAGEIDDAISHMQALLCLNPADNQGIRFHLLNLLADAGEGNRQSSQFFEKYEQDETAFSKYACALWKFSTAGDGKDSQKALKKAIVSNKFVPALITGKIEDPGLPATRAVRGTPLEAIAYARLYKDIWMRNRDSIKWLEKHYSALLSSPNILRKIASEKPFTFEGQWVCPAPVELSNF